MKDLKCHHNFGHKHKMNTKIFIFGLFKNGVNVTLDVSTIGLQILCHPQPAWDGRVGIW